LRAAHTPKLVPPVPIAVTWKPQRLTPSLELGAPLVAMTAGDLDGDGKVELYAVTSREVIALAVTSDRHVTELARVAFTGEAAVPAPRDAVGTAVIDGHALYASSSAFVRGIVVTWRGKRLVGDPGEPGATLCPGERAQLVFGRNYFGDDKAGYYAVRCRDVPDASGHLVRVRAVVGLSGKLDVTLASCTGATCEHAGDYSVAHAGTAFDIADLDRDGTPEVVVAGAAAPGDPDDVRVFSIGDDERKPKWKKAFTAGGVAALAVAELDGAPAIIAAVRLVGATRIDLWRLD
jgi:hypothetical protein